MFISHSNRCNGPLDVFIKLYRRAAVAVVSAAQCSRADAIMAEFVVSRKDGNVLWIRINRPAKRNAVTPSMYRELSRLLEEASDDPSIKVTALTGTGQYFSSGSDLSRPEGDPHVETEKADQRAFYTYVKTLIEHQKPLLALVNGPAVGAAVTVLALFDQVVATDKATFHTPFAELGVTPEAVSSYTFPLIMGHQKAAHLLLFSQKMSAREAFECGLVSKLIPDYTFRQSSVDFVRFASRLSWQAMMQGKKLMRAELVDKMLETHEKETVVLGERFRSAEVRAILAAKFKSKSKI